MSNDEDKLYELMQNSEQYYSTQGFIISAYRFELIPSKTDLQIRKDLTDTFDRELGICDECYCTNDNCRCSWRYDYDEDDEYDRYYDR